MWSPPGSSSSRGGENPDLTPEEAETLRAQDQRRLEEMTAYCQGEACLRGKLLDYFGQAHPPACGNCGVCRGDFVATDITKQAQMILSCIQRIHGKLGYYVGVTLVTQVLRGSRAGRVRELGLEDLSTYGLLKGTPAGRLRRWVEALEGAGYVYLEPQYQTLRPTPRAKDVLFRGAQVTFLPETGGGGPPAGQGRPGSAGRPLGGGGAAGCP